jgi:hypothetical protein
MRIGILVPTTGRVLIDNINYRTKAIEVRHAFGRLPDIPICAGFP